MGAATNNGPGSFHGLRAGGMGRLPAHFLLPYLGPRLARLARLVHVILLHVLGRAGVPHAPGRPYVARESSRGAGRGRQWPGNGPAGPLGAVSEQLYSQSYFDSKASGN